MSVEAAGIWATIKVWWGLVFAPIFWYIWKRIDNTYSKDETDRQIKLHIDPLKESVDRNTDATIDLSKTLVDFRLEVAKRRDG